MFDFLRQEPKPTTEMVAEGLFNVVIESKEIGADLVEDFKHLEIDQTRGLTELLYLRAVAVDIAITTALRAGPKRDEILSGYRARLDQLLVEGYSIEDFHTRKVAYIETFKDAVMRGSNGYWDVALKFAEFCGGKDIAVVTLGQTFAVFLNNTHKFLKSTNVAT
jgi:hypothetical protein